MNDTERLSDAERREKLWHLIKDIRFGMFTTVHENGHLHSRPMTTQNRKVDQDDSLWFFMSRSREPVADLERHDQVNVVYADASKDTYVSVSGVAQVVDDPQRRKQMWSTMNEAWFPGGPDDPDVALVRVAITHADYWDNQENKLVQLMHMAMAAVRQQPPKDMGDRGRVQMH